MVRRRRNVYRGDSEESLYLYDGNAYNEQQLTDLMKTLGITVVSAHQMIEGKLQHVVFSVSIKKELIRWDEIHSWHNWTEVREECIMEGPLFPKKWEWNGPPDRSPTKKEYENLKQQIISGYGDSNVFLTGGRGPLRFEEDGIYEDDRRDIGFLGREINPKILAISTIINQPIIEAVIAAASDPTQVTLENIRGYNRELKQMRSRLVLWKTQAHVGAVQAVKNAEEAFDAIRTSSDKGTAMKEASLAQEKADMKKMEVKGEPITLGDLHMIMSGTTPMTEYVHTWYTIGEMIDWCESEIAKSKACRTGNVTDR